MNLPPDFAAGAWVVVAFIAGYFVGYIRGAVK